MAKELIKENKDSESLQEIIDMSKEQKEYLKTAQEKSEKKKRNKNMNNFKKAVKEKGDMNYYTFFKKLKLSEQEVIISQMESLNKLIKMEKPYRMQLLNPYSRSFQSLCSKKNYSFKIY